MRRDTPLQKGRLLGALLIAVAFIAGAYVYKTFGETRGAESVAALPPGVAVLPTPQREYIPAIDTDGDGLQDWEEALIKDSEVAIETAAAAYETPTTVTGQFGTQFLQDMIYAEQLGEFGASNEELAASAFQSLSREAVDELYTSFDIKTGSDNSERAIRAYGNAVATVMDTHSIQNTENEAILMRQALESEDPEKIAEIRAIQNAYVGMRDGMLALTVPPVLAEEHLDLVNVLDALVNDITAMGNVNEDPLYALVRFKRYQDDAAALFYVFQNINVKILNEGILYENGEPGFVLLAFTPLE